MQKIGLTLITLSFLAGSYLTVLDHLEVNWGYLLPFLVLGFVGVGLVQLGKKRAAQDSEAITENLSIIERSLNNIVEKVTYLSSEKETIFTYDMAPKIDELLIEDLNTFVDARKMIGNAYGLQAYADVMNHFAGGERYLNRVWSASVDGYMDEVNDYIVKAREQFELAHQKFQGLQANG
jgi:hypothetical protein